MESPNSHGAAVALARRTSIRTLLLVVAAAAGLAASSVVAAPPAHAADGFVRGAAAADAKTFGLSASLGGANAGLMWGASSASYREGYAAAAAKPLDLGLLRLLLGEPSQCPGSTDPVPLPDASLPANYETNTMQSTAGTVVQGESDFPGFYGAPSPGKVGSGTALATAVPYSTATTATPTIDLGVFKIVNPSTRSETSLQNDVRLATATATAERIEFLGGLLAIDEPTWTATVRSGATSTHEGGFTVAGGTLFGAKRTPAEAMGDLKGAAQWVEWLLGYVGLGLDLPETTIEGDLVSVSPLNLHLTNSPLGKDIVAPLFLSKTDDGLTVEEAVTKALDEWAAKSCDNKRYRQLAPILIDLVKGTGVIGLPMGGVTVSTDDTPPPDYEAVVPFEVPAVEALDDAPTGPAVLGDSVPFDDGSYAGYGATYDDTPSLEPDAPPAEAPPTDVGPEVVEFASGGVSRSRTILGQTGGPVVWLGGLLAVLGGAAFVSERAWRAHRLRRLES